MDIRGSLTRENVGKGIKKLRINVTQTTIMTYSALALILFIAFMIRLFPIRWEIPTGSIHLSEFDPYFQFRFTQFIVNNGFISWNYPTQWIDTQRWFPSGINVAVSAYPGLPMTAAFLYQVVTAIGVNIPLMNFCALLAPIFSTLTIFALYFVGKDIGGRSMGLIAALLLALDPSHVQRTGLGFFDDETVGLFAFMMFIFLFLRAIESERPLKSTLKYAIASGITLGYFTATWGAAYYPIGLFTLFVFVMVLLKRYSPQLFLTYSLTFGIGLAMAINVPRLSASYLTTFAILPVAGVFFVLCLAEVFRNVSSLRWKTIATIVFAAVLIAGFAALWQLGFLRGIAGKFVSVLDPFARTGAPLIESVAEHRISAWGSIFYEFGIEILFFVAGLYFVVRNPSNRNIFLLVFGITALYFASSMVRLFVVLAPAFGLLAAAGIIGVLKPFITLLKEPPKINIKKKLGMDHVGREFSAAAILMVFIILMTSLAYPLPTVYKQAYAPITVTASSLPIAPSIPVRQWLDMLQWTNDNLNSATIVDSWWDYGYWLTILGNVTSLADNATINGTQIENVGFSFMANETQSVRMLRRYGARYILVFVTFAISNNAASMYDGGGGDNGKWTWMARISGQASQRFIDEGLLTTETAWTNETTFGSYSNTTNKFEWNPVGRDSTIYKLMFWGKSTYCTTNSVTDADAGNVTQPVYFKEAFFSGKTLTSSDASNNYGGIVPLVCLYEVDYAKFDADYPSG